MLARVPTTSMDRLALPALSRLLAGSIPLETTAKVDVLVCMVLLGIIHQKHASVINCKSEQINAFFAGSPKLGRLED